MEDTWIKKGDKVVWTGEWAAQEKPMTGRVVGFAGEYVAVQWDHRPNAIMPGLLRPDSLAPVDPLQTPVGALMGITRPKRLKIPKNLLKEGDRVIIGRREQVRGTVVQPLRHDLGLPGPKFLVHLDGDPEDRLTIFRYDDSFHVMDVLDRLSEL